MQLDQRDVLHDPRPTRSTWTRVNSAEAVPGVPTPLTWTWVYPVVELSWRHALADMGAIHRSEVTIPDDVDQRLITAFYGRCATNLDATGRLTERIPGVSRRAVESQAWAASTDGEPASSRTWLRDVRARATKARAVALARRRLARLDADAERWWRSHVFGPDQSAEAARAVLADARERWLQACRLQVVISMVAAASFDALQRASAAQEMGPDANVLVTADRPVHEAATVSELWEISRGRGSLAGFLERHGFHGPDESELASRVWREDSSAVEQLIASYRTLGEDQRPDRQHADKLTARAEAERRLLEGMERRQRRAARRALRQARAFVPAREQARSAFLKAYDVGRWAARRIGRDLAARGILDDAEDVFFLTVDEILAGAPDDARLLVSHRRAMRTRYEGMELPDTFTGTPEPIDATAGSGDDVTERVTTVTGIGASAGVVEATACVVASATDADALSPGDVLVCSTTDPSWAAYFFIAAAVVIDVGGPISHGAILARELGIPCVINTRVGTRVIATGERVRVDGTAGTVELLDRSGGVAAGSA